MKRFADYFKVAFLETKKNNGIIESPIQHIEKMQTSLDKYYTTSIPDKLWIKLDNDLPISGSIKARGGIYEVLKTAEDIAIKNKMLKQSDSYEKFASKEFYELFSQYSIAVGSTGNLGLAIGIISAKLGFHVTVHMSADAREWKKALLRSKGVTVKEYKSDYSLAVAEGRREAEKDKRCHFVDDENSKTLFLGYAVAALRLRDQFAKEHILVDEGHPLFVYLPCGVGGGPGGVTFGIKLIFGDNAHCFFAEPTHSCSMMLGLATGLNSKISVQDIGLDNITAADGLAVGRASSFVGKVVGAFISGCYSISDNRLYELVAQNIDAQNIKLEPSAVAVMYGPVLLATNESMKTYCSLNNIVPEAIVNSIQLVWATGGSMVPPSEMEHYYLQGEKLLKEEKN